MLSRPDEALTDGIIKGLNESLREKRLDDKEDNGNLRSIHESGEKEILHTYRVIDSAGTRPLYLIALAVAWMQGKSVCEWHLKDLLDYVYKRELEHMQANAKLASESDAAQLQEGYAQLWCLATMSGGIDIAEIEKALQTDDFDSFIRLHLADAGLPTLLLKTMSKHMGNGTAIQPYTPDIPGEYYVLRKTKDLSSHLFDTLLATAWARNSKLFAGFLSCIATDFQEDWPDIWNRFL